MKRIINFLIIFILLINIVNAIISDEIVYLKLDEIDRAENYATTTAHTIYNFKENGDITYQQPGFNNWSSYSVQFGGSNDFLDNDTFESSLMPSIKEATVCAWVFPDFDADETFINAYIDSSNGFQLITTADGSYGQIRCKMGSGGSDVYSLYSMPDDNTEHFLFCCDFNATHQNLYMNGSLVDSDVHSGFGSSNKFEVGASIDAVDFFISDVFLINRSIGGDGIRELIGNAGFSVPNNPPTTPIILSPLNNSINSTIDILFYSTDLDDDILSYNVYINDTFNGSANITNWIGESGYYNLKISAYDGEDYSDNSTSFFILDSVIPVITTTVPNENNLSQFNNTNDITLSSLFTDDRDIYSFNVSVYVQDTGQIMLSNYTTISGSSYSFVYTLNNTLYPNTTIQEDITLCDSHTKEDIKEADNIILLSNSINYDFDGINIIISDMTGESIETTTVKEKDRYTFQFKYKKYLNYKSYKLTSNDYIKYLSNSKFKGHFIINNYWIDFEQYGNVEIEKISDYEYNIIVYNDNNTINFNSIGELNCVTESYEFLLNAVSVIPPITTGEAINNFNTYFLYAFFIVIQLCLLVLGMKYENRFIVLLSNLMAVLLSISFIRFVTLNDFFKHSLLIYIFVNIILAFAVLGMKN